jgi:hypothetical protein
VHPSAKYQSLLAKYVHSAYSYPAQVEDTPSAPLKSFGGPLQIEFQSALQTGSTTGLLLLDERVS